MLLDVVVHTAAAIPSAVNDADRRPGKNDDNSGEFTETGTNRKGKATHESVLGDQTVPYKNTAKKFNSVANSRSQGKWFILEKDPFVYVVI